MASDSKTIERTAADRRPPEISPRRLAVLSAPRSGNTWLRRLLSSRYELEEVAVFEVGDLPSSPPSAVAIQLHWPPTSSLLSYLDEFGVTPVSIARHPLDVFLSVLHFASHEPATRRWLGADLTRPLVGQGPTTAAFREFVLGEGAARLLAVTTAWWSRPDTIRIRYEDLSDDGPGTLEDLGVQLGWAPHASLDVAVAAGDFTIFQAMPNHHGWQGRVGLWGRLVDADLAREAFEVHRDAFAILGYDLDLNPNRTTDEIHAAWQELMIPRPAQRP
jgi:hypothetical protein